MTKDNIGQAIQEVYTKLAGLDADARSKVIRAVLAAFDEAPPVAPPVGNSSGQSPPTNGSSPPTPGDGAWTPKTWMAAKKPSSDVERVACLGAYIANFRGEQAFNTKDLTKLNQEAHQPKIGNMAQAVANATKKSQYLAPAGAGKKQLTVRGEAVVEALPDKEKVRLAHEEHPLKKTRVKRKGKGAKA